MTEVVTGLQRADASGMKVDLDSESSVLCLYTQVAIGVDDIIKIVEDLTRIH